MCAFATLLFSAKVDALNGQISVMPNTNLAVVGSTFQVTVRVQCSEMLGSWNFGVSYDTSTLAYVGGAQLSIADYGNGTFKTKDYVYTFKALKSGSGTIRISGANMVSWNDPNPPVLPVPTTGSATITVKTQAEIQASYSKDNYLKSITVEGYEISPAFDKNTLEYTVLVPDTVEQIKVGAVLNDARSRVTGTGTIDISEGANKIELVVTAQNGSIKTYTLNVNVKDINPISAIVDGVEYTVVKKDTLLTEPTGFTKSTIKIGDEEVPAYKNERSDLTVVGLKDSQGKIGMFLYDENDKTYASYNELKNISFTLLPIEIESVPDGFKKDKLEINGVEREVMRSEIDENFYLIYAMNVETGDKDYFQYDKETGALIKYNSKIFDEMHKESKEMLLYALAALGVAGIFLLLSIVLGARVSKLKKLIRKVASTKPVISMNEEEQKEDVVDSELPSTKEEDSDLSTTEGEPISMEEEIVEEEQVDEEFSELESRRKKKKRKRR